MTVKKAVRDVSTHSHVNRRLSERINRTVDLMFFGLLPVFFFLLAIVLWAASVHLFNIPKYLLPGPVEVIWQGVNSRESLWRNGLITVQEIFLGFFVTVVTALPLGLLIALSSVARRMIYPMLIFIQLVPKIAIAPLFIIWAGFGMESKILLTMMMTFSRY
jgi:NitT/TauT family transport system permease protein